MTTVINGLHSLFVDTDADLQISGTTVFFPCTPAPPAVYVSSAVFVVPILDRLLESDEVFNISIDTSITDTFRFSNLPLPEPVGITIISGEGKYVQLNIMHGI